ncbi:aspartate/glutamate racemase family protein [Clostridium sp.]|uniref:aspartate/glutamate racemase family protein n=1 Tax=Clostridium sp. TaxID=1506 RepID=UPI003217DD16
MHKKYKIAVINILTMDEEEELNKHGKIMESYFPNLETTSFCVDDQYEGVHDDNTHEKAAKKVVDLGKSIYENFDGIVVSCTGDPGVEELKKEINIPVIGAGRSVSSCGLNFGKKIGVIGIREMPSEAIRCALGENLRRYIKPNGIKNVNDLFTDQGNEVVVNAVRELESDGMDVVVLACTGISNIGIDKFLNERLSIPIIDPVYAQGFAINAICNFQKEFKQK